MKKALKWTLFLILLVSCRQATSPVPISNRLVDLYKPNQGLAKPSKNVETLPRTEWRFSKQPATSPEKFPETHGWEAGPGVSNLAIQNGLLTGKCTTYFPLLHLERTSGLDDKDLLHSIEIRMRVSEGTELSFSYDDSNKPIDFKKTMEYATNFPWQAKTKLIPGDQMQTYTLLGPRLPAAADLKHLLIRPSDVVGAKFEIESIRLIFRKEYLAGIPSGIGWEGLAQIYHETIVSHAPEKIEFNIQLPMHPWLDASLGMLENQPVTFHAAIRTPEAEDILMDRTVTTPNRWEAVQLDLTKYANQRVTLSLSLQAENPGAIGFWGSPVIRSNNAMPRTAAGKIPEMPPQGVILIMADTLRRDHLDTYGYKRATAPNLQQLAREGTLFQDCISQATWTKVATPSLMTSLYPTSHGVHDFSDRLPASATTIAEVFHDAGYATLSLSSVLFTGAYSNLQQGFDELHEDTSLPDKDSSKTARIYMDRLLPWLDVHRSVPFFVYLHIADPHDPYRPYAPYDTMWADAGKNTEQEQLTQQVRSKISDPLLKGAGMPTRVELERAGIDPDEYEQQNRDWYDGSIRAMDAEIGRLMERLRTLGIDQKTAVIFIADHGEEFLEHGRTFHGQTVYGELANVPLIFWSPGLVPKGKTIQQTVETIDVMPTILELSRLMVPSQAEGKSLLPLIFEKSANWNRPAITEKAITSQTGAPPPRDTESYSIVSGQWKLIHNTKRPDGGLEFELYDERKDPLNLTDLSTNHQDVVRRLSKDLETWHQLALKNRLKPDSENPNNLTQEQLERLRSLGYVN